MVMPPPKHRSSTLPPKKKKEPDKPGNSRHGDAKKEQ
jgi:hypothetical protein